MKKSDNYCRNKRRKQTKNNYNDKNKPKMVMKKVNLKKQTKKGKKEIGNIYIYPKNNR